MSENRQIALMRSFEPLPPDFADVKMVVVNDKGEVLSYDVRGADLLALQDEKYIVEDLADMIEIPLEMRELGIKPSPMLIATTKTAKFGARIMLRRDVLRDLERRFGPFWIVPIGTAFIVIEPKRTSTRSDESRQEFLDEMNSISDKNALNWPVSDYVFSFDDGVLTANGERIPTPVQILSKKFDS